MKTFLIATLLLCSAFAQLNCPLPCNPDRPLCPPESTCSSFSLNGIPVYACACNQGTVPQCTGISSEPFSCTSRNQTSTGCGPYFPNGCPIGTVCVQGDSPSTTRCVCSDQTAIMVSPGVCIPQCPMYSTYNLNTQRCECVPPYVRDTNATNALRCVPGTVTCESIQCPSGFVCQPASSEFPTARCVPQQGVPICGRDYHCPSTQVCRDTLNGPVCVCPDGFGGPNCAYRKCWSFGNSTANVGCWVFNSSAECVPTSTGEAYCVCKDGTLPPDCVGQDNRCSTVDCSNIPNSRCIDGSCRCIEGYVAVPTGDATTRFSCQPRSESGCNSLNCTGNKVCHVFNGQPQCVCPPDTFGSFDCSRPSCASDSDCNNAGLVSSFCVQSTRPNVTSFCACKPGWTGEHCNTSINTCPSVCPFSNSVCNNERACACAAGFIRVNDTCNPNPTGCIMVTLTLRARPNGTVTAEELQSLLANLLSIDVSNINVEGPTPVDGTNKVQYVIKICGDQNVDQGSASQDLVDKVNSGSDQGIGIDSVQMGDQTTTGTSGANAVAFSFGILVVALIGIVELF